MPEYYIFKNILDNFLNVLLSNLNIDTFPRYIKMNFFNGSLGTNIFTFLKGYAIHFIVFICCIFRSLFESFMLLGSIYWRRYVKFFSWTFLCVIKGWNDFLQEAFLPLHPSAVSLSTHSLVLISLFLFHPNEVV